ncbi:HU family DNA-binding protein [Olivibacter sitiensis]|uniref:HU family DNA-binding protein n=1 Tax=Olivibacter sitiensis TaxID=376470 RepID=UPI00040FAF39|nr:HU family DNA-binding protein [Olivibacter sitiensis]
MAVKYKVVERGNPQRPDDPKKFYSKPITSGEVNLEQLSEDISDASTLNVIDVSAVLTGLIRAIPRQISDGRIVRLGNLGSFRLGSRSQGSETADEVSGRNITSRKLIFTPGKLVRERLATISFERE